jgi:hypothetical protein
MIENTHNEKEDSEHSKAHELNKLPSVSIDEEETSPVAGYQPSDRKDEITNGDGLQVLKGEFGRHRRGVVA